MYGIQDSEETEAKKPVKKMKRYEVRGAENPAWKRKESRGK